MEAVDGKFTQNDLDDVLNEITNLELLQKLSFSGKRAEKIKELKESIKDYYDDWDE